MNVLYYILIAKIVIFYEIHFFARQEECFIIIIYKFSSASEKRCKKEDVKSCQKLDLTA